jgi:hypothetical protein
MKYLYESIEEQKRIPLSKLTWDKIAPEIDTNAPKWKWQKDTVDLPKDFMSSSRIKGEDQFETWFQKFVKEWGTEGELVETRPTYWSLVGNRKWDNESELGSNAVSKFYGDKRSGDYVGD